MAGGKGGIAQSEVGKLLGATRAFAARSTGARTPDQLGAELVELRHVIDLLELDFSRSAAEFAATDGYDDKGSISPVDWIRHSCRMGSYAAAERVCVGEHLDRLPQTVAAVAGRRIGFAHLALIARTSDALNKSVAATTFSEQALLSQALETSVGRFRHLCYEARHAFDPVGYAVAEVITVLQRELEINSGEGGAVFIRGLLDAAGGAALRTALEPLARKSGADDDRHRERRLADALVELAHHALDTGSLPQRASQRAHLQVTTSLDALLGLSGTPASDLEFSLPISSEIVRRLACDCTVTRVLLGSDSAIVDIGRGRRVVSSSTRRALNVRDKSCQWPGCDRPVAWTEAHHLVHWAHGGKTDLPNLVLLCHRHHWMVHEGGWQILRDDAGRILTIPSDPYLFRRRQIRGPDQVAVA